MSRLKVEFAEAGFGWGHMFKSCIAIVVLAFIFFWAPGLPSSQPAQAANGSVAYTYDPLGRITTASYDTGVCVIYTYDPSGNRLSETINVSTAGSTGVWGCFNWNASGGALWGN